MNRGERGSATLVGVASVLAVLAMLAVALQLGLAVISRHQAEAAADLAALAVAGHAVYGADVACGDGQRVAERMSVRLVGCQLRGWQADVRVEARPAGLLAQFGVVRATARAGPVTGIGEPVTADHDERSPHSGERPGGDLAGAGGGTDHPAGGRPTTEHGALGALVALERPATDSTHAIRFDAAAGAFILTPAKYSRGDENDGLDRHLAQRLPHRAAGGGDRPGLAPLAGRAGHLP